MIVATRRTVSVSDGGRPHELCARKVGAAASEWAEDCIGTAGGQSAPPPPPNERNHLLRLCHTVFLDAPSAADPAGPHRRHPSPTADHTEVASADTQCVAVSTLAARLERLGAGPRPGLAGAAGLNDGTR